MVETTSFASNADVDHVLAIDIGATKIAAGLITSNGEVLRRNQLPTMSHASADTVLDQLKLVVEGVRSGREIACGVGTTGPFGRAPGVLESTTIPAWRGYPLVRRIREVTGLATYVANDGQAFTLAEGWLGAARGSTDFVGLVVSTGIGGGIVSGGKLLTGATGNAGHVGHMPAGPTGRECVCGGHGCLEAGASGWAIAELSSGDAATAPFELVEQSAQLVGSTLAAVFNLLDLRQAVIGGSVALGYGERFLAVVRRTAESQARLSYSRGPDIRLASLGAEAPLVGAARVGMLGWTARLPDGLLSEA